MLNHKFHDPELARMAAVASDLDAAMAWGNPGVFVNPMIGTLKQTAGVVFDLDTDVFKIALYNNTPTPNYSDTLANSVYLVGQWVTGNEVTGTNWAAGGVALSSPTVTESPTGTIMWNASNVSVATTTIATSIYGCLIYDSTLTTKYALCAIPFSGGPYGTSAGTFGITWAGGGIWNWDVTP